MGVEEETKKSAETKKPEEKTMPDPTNIDAYIEALKIMNAEKPKKPKRGLWMVISFFIMIAVAIGAYLLTKH